MSQTTQTTQASDSNSKTEGDASFGASAKAPLALFALSAGLLGLDVVEDLRVGSGVTHLAMEAAVTALCLLGAAWAWRRVTAERRDALRVQGALQAEARRWQGEARRWRQEAEASLRGLGEAIDRQFDRWGLSPAEREVGLLLIKGLSLKEVAEVRGTSERTARQQARAVYQKGELSGRAELAAFFLEDLLAPESGPTSTDG